MFAIFMFMVVIACWLLSKTDDAARDIRNRNSAKESGDFTYYDHKGKLRLTSNKQNVYMSNGSIFDTKTKEVIHDKIEDAVKEVNRECINNKLNCYIKLIKIDKYSTLAKDHKYRMAIPIDKNTGKPFWLEFDQAGFYRYDFADDNVPYNTVIYKKKIIREEPSVYKKERKEIDYDTYRKYDIIYQVQYINNMINNTGC